MNNAASLLAKTRTRLIGVAFDLGQSFHIEAIDHVYREAAASDYAVVLSAVTESRPLEDAIDPLVSGSCEGVLIIGADTVPDALRGPSGIMPVVVLGHARWSPDFDVVRTAGDLGVEEAVAGLAAQGHQDIAHVDGGASSGSQERRQGYRTGMERLGLASWIHVEPGGDDELDGLRAGRRLLRLGTPPTAVVCYNDSSAVGVIQAVQEAGLSVPADMSVVGYDNSPVSRTNYLSLTTVAQDIPRLTSLAVRRLIAAIEDPALVHEEFILPPHVIRRATTAPPRPRADRTATT